MEQAIRLLTILEEAGVLSFYIPTFYYYFLFLLNKIT